MSFYKAKQFQINHNAEHNANNNCSKILINYKKAFTITMAHKDASIKKYIVTLYVSNINTV